MAWNEINYSCGHSDRIQMYGPTSGRERKKEWMERGICPDCYRKQKKEEREKASQVAAEQAKKSGLPALAGSERQIAWADTIRKNALASAQNNVLSRDVFATLPVEKRESSRGVFEVVRTARDRLETETSATWWIDNRDSVNRYCISCGEAALKTINA
jgi:hypothetical protein